MLTRMIVPLDGSALAEEILPHVRTILRRTDAQIILVRAVIPVPGEDALVAMESALATARDYLQQVQDRMVEQGLRVTSRTLVGSPAQVILEVAEEELETTMIALATHGRTGLKRLLLGSVAERVIRKSRVPVLVVRPFWSYELLPVQKDAGEAHPLRTILLPLDGTSFSPSIVSPVTDMAALFGSRLVLLHVVDPKEDSPGREDAESIGCMNRISLELKAAGLDPLSMVRRGTPATEILEAARILGADLIAMATHGLSGLSRLVAGSVTEKVLRAATCPVLVARPPKRILAKAQVQGECVGR
jgi:nucleotide-binding universal stress UspA family protein